jgi:rRNA processing protein Gar1
MAKLPEIGDTVLISWAGELVEVQVEEVYGPVDRPHLLVWVPVHGASGEVLDRQLFNVPATAVQERQAA